MQIALTKFMLMYSACFSMKLLIAKLAQMGDRQVLPPIVICIVHFGGQLCPGDANGNKAE